MGRIFASAGSVATIFPYPPRHHAFTITSLARTSPDGFSANAASVLQNRQ